jgi:steroid delta-isomerase-like uncharacterized protein
MNTAKNKALIERLFTEAMNARKFTVLQELLAPEFLNHSMPMPYPGPDGFRVVLEGFTNAFPDMQINLERLIGEDDLVVTSGHWTGTHKGDFMGIPATGKKVNIKFMDIWKIENDKAVGNWVQMDNLSIMQQLGVMQPA